MSARDDARAALDAWDDAVSDWAGHAQALAEALQAVLDEQSEPERAQSQQGWAAEQEPDDAERTAIRGMWYPYIQLQGSMGVDLDIHFPTEQDCLEFIRDEVLGVGFFPGVEPESARAQSQDELRDAPFGPLTTAAWSNAHTPGREAHQSMSLWELVASNPTPDALFEWLDAHDRDVEAAALYKARRALQDDQIEQFGVILPDVEDVVNWLDDRAQWAGEQRIRVTFSPADPPKWDLIP